MKKLLENIKEILAMIITLIVAIAKEDKSTAQLMGEALGIMSTNAAMKVVVTAKKFGRYIRKNVVDLAAMLISFAVFALLIIVCNTYITEPSASDAVVVEMKYQQPLHEMVTITDEDSTITVELVKLMETLVTKEEVVATIEEVKLMEAIHIPSIEEVKLMETLVTKEEVVELTKEEIELMEAIHIPSIEEVKWAEVIDTKEEIVDVSELVHITFDELPWVDTMEEKMDMIELLLINGLKVLLYKGEFYKLSEDQFVAGKETTDTVTIYHYEYIDRDHLLYYSGTIVEYSYSMYGDYVVYMSYND